MPFSRLLPALAVVAFVPFVQGQASAQSGDRDCGDFGSQAAAQDYYEARGGAAQDPDRLDEDNDGVACESRPCPCRGPSPRPQPTATPTTTPSPTPTAPAPAPSTTPAPEEPEQPGSEALGTPLAARVVSVIDGDTVKVRRGKRKLTVRLIGLDTPESRKPGVPVECGARKAAAAMKALVLDRRGRGRAVTLTADSSQDATDAFGRRLYYVAVGGKDVGKRLIVGGHSTAYVFERRFARYPAYFRSQEAAESARRGVWGACNGDFHSEQ